MIRNILCKLSEEIETFKGPKIEGRVKEETKKKTTYIWYINVFRKINANIVFEVKSWNLICNIVIRVYSTNENLPSTTDDGTWSPAQ